MWCNSSRISPSKVAVRIDFSAFGLNVSDETVAIGKIAGSGTFAGNEYTGVGVKKL